MDFTIPKSAEAPLRELMKLSPEERARLADAVRQAKPVLGVQKFLNEVASQWGGDPDTVEDIIAMLSGMYLARIDMDATVDDFVAGIASALRKQAEMPKDFEQSLKSILSAEDSLGITAKAFDLLMDQEHCCHSVRIISDVRHVFPNDASQRPKAALIIHTLNLVYHEIGAVKEIHVALDSSDLKRLTDRSVG